jgi:hypothetical protein
MIKIDVWKNGKFEVTLTVESLKQVNKFLGDVVKDKNYGFVIREAV